MRNKLIKGLIVLLIIGTGYFLAERAGMFLPGWIEWNTKIIEEDLDGDGIVETVELGHKRIKIYKEQSLLFESEDWKVSDVLTGDVDHDGETDLIFIIWNRSNFGRSHPFFEENDTGSWYQHLYVYNLRDNELHAKWMSSGLRPNIARLEISNEGELYLTDPENTVSVWAWIDWGFEKISQ